MEPLLYSGDSILVDTSDRAIQDGRVYAIRYGQEMRVKRLFVRLDGTITLRSDNPAYKDEDVPEKVAQEHIAVIGRVRDKSGNGGL
jgi:phage repressor protein C with HTH and peptisase S24 domain